MVRKISELVATKIVLNTKLEEDKEIYVYGLQIILNTLVSMGLVLLIGYCFHIFYETIFFLVSYSSIRLYAGGFHASSNEKCIGIFLLGYLVISFILSNVEPVTCIYLTLVLCLLDISIFMWAPVEAYNNPIPEQKKRGMKLKAFSISSIITIVILFMMHFDLEIGIWGFAGVCWFWIIFVAGKMKNTILRRKQP